MVAALVCAVLVPGTEAQVETVRQQHRRFYSENETLQIGRVLGISGSEDKRLGTVILTYNMVMSRLQAEWRCGKEVVARTPMSRGLHEKVRHGLDCPASAATVRFVGSGGRVQLEEIEAEVVPVVTAEERISSSQAQAPTALSGQRPELPSVERLRPPLLELPPWLIEALEPAPVDVVALEPTTVGWGSSLFLTVETEHRLETAHSSGQLEVGFAGRVGVSPLRVLRRGVRRDKGVYSLTVKIPEGAMTRPVDVSAFGIVGRSSAELTVVGPPRITAISPSPASPWDVIRIEGEQFAPGWLAGPGGGTAVAFPVRYGGAPVAFGPGDRGLRATPTMIEVRVPPNAVSGTLTVKTIVSGVSYSTEHPIEIVPDIESIYPSVACAGGQVSISGRGFDPDTSVEFGGVAAEIVERSGDSQRIRVRLPRQTGPTTVRVTTSEGGVATSEDLRIASTPVIDEVPTQTVAEGDTVAISGQQLDLVDRASVGVSRPESARGFTADLVGESSATSARVRIPAGIDIPGPATLTVFSKCGWSNRFPIELSARGMQLRIPKIVSFPAHAAIGAKIFVDVANLPYPVPDRVTIRFNGTPGVVEEIYVSPDRQDPRTGFAYKLTVRVPDSATSGPVSVSTYGVEGVSGRALRIFRPPTITEITPAIASPGDIVDVRGSDFVLPGVPGEGTTVYLIRPDGSSREMPIAALRSDRWIRIRIPPNVATGDLQVSTIVSGIRFRSKEPKRLEIR